jgi:hypothetical protein
MCLQEWNLVYASGRGGGPQTGEDVQQAKLPHRGESGTYALAVKVRRIGRPYPSNGSAPQRCVGRLLPQNR